MERRASRGRVVLLLDEVHILPEWAARLKGEWDRLRRRRLPVHVVATGSSALRLARGSRESLAGRFERLTLTHWPAAALATTFGLSRAEAVRTFVTRGSYPGAMALLADPARRAAYVRDAIIEPAVGRDIPALGPVRRPALLRQVFGVAVASPAEIVALQKIRGQLQDAGALETIAHYLALLAATAVGGPPSRDQDPARFGKWLENACLAFAWNAGQRVAYWREQPWEVDGVLEGDWGRWAIEVKTGRFATEDLLGLLQFVRRFPADRPLVLCDPDQVGAGTRAGVDAMSWEEYLWAGPGGLGGRPAASA